MPIVSSTLVRLSHLIDRLSGSGRSLENAKQAVRLGHDSEPLRPDGSHRPYLGDDADRP